MPGRPSSGSAPGEPGSELDRALHELMERAGDVMQSQDRLRALLRATQAVVQPRLRGDPQPEQAYEDLPLTTLALRSSAARQAPRPRYAPTERPLWLYHPPCPLEVIAVAPDGPPRRIHGPGLNFEVARFSGPERIETGWWRGPHVRRDYYQIESRQGTRYWIFRRLSDGQWFLQGEFI